MRTSTFLAAMSVFALAGFPAGAITFARPDGRETDAALRKAIEFVESGGDPRKVGDGGRAVGILQIHPVMVDDCNRILGRDEFTYSDRRDVAKSRRMFWIYSEHYSRGASREVIARRWNGGPTGDTKAATAGYWSKVKAAIKD